MTIPKLPITVGSSPTGKCMPSRTGWTSIARNRYRLVGAKSAVCTYDRETGKIGWSNPSPKCVGELRSRLSFFMSCHHCLSVYSILMCLFCIISSFLSFSLAIVCPALPDITYGQVEVTGTRQGDKANYFCNYGFYLSGNKQRVCQNRWILEWS